MWSDIYQIADKTFTFSKKCFSSSLTKKNKKKNFRG